MGEGGRVEIAKLWEPQQGAEDEGSKGGGGGDIGARGTMT